MSWAPRRIRSSRFGRGSKVDFGSGERGRISRGSRSRMAIVIVSCLLTACIVHGWGPAFGFRQGQTPQREIRLKVSGIERRNALRTNGQRQFLEDAVLPRMVNDPQAVLDLIKSIEDLAAGTITATKPDDLPENIIQKWGMIDRETFDDLREANDVPERRSQFSKEIQNAFAPIIKDGLLSSAPLPRQYQNARNFAIRQTVEGPSQWQSVPIDNVLHERLTRKESDFYRHFVASIRPPELGQRLFDLVSPKLAQIATLTYDEQATTLAREAARSNVPDIYDQFKRGDLIVEQGQPIDTENLDLLRLEHEAFVSSFTPGAMALRWVAAIGLCAALYGFIIIYLVRNEPRIAHNTSRILLLCVLLNCLLMARIVSIQTWDAETLPVAVCGMIATIAFGMDVAIIFSLGLSILTCLSLGVGIDEAIVLFSGTTAGVVTLGDVRSRTKIIKVGFVIGLVNFLMTWMADLWQQDPPGLILSISLWRACWGIMAGFFLGGILPFLETNLGLVTGISLLELADARHPLLQELVRRAPGTYNHSVTVGALAEAAAERIGANALLVRVGAYFHDIGKMIKPDYFVENQPRGQTSRHQGLSPSISTMIIIGHVKDGYELGREHNLPQPILDLIQQHHGTTLVEYFYREATRREEAADHPGHVLEGAYRYPGPRPQSREAAILMICDAAESASRTLSDPTPARLESLVSQLIDKRLADNQFDDCGMTLKELAEIRKSITKSLIAIYHARIKYPEPRSA
jgi:cyclic-di-AMP phosphodiesterase PgpH